MRAAIYARVSTEDQAKEGFSIPAQLKRLNAYCKARNWQGVTQYVDEGFSGRDMKRPAYQRMMDEKDKWDVLVVLKMDRIHRNSRNFAQMMDSLNEWGKEFNSMQEAFDTTTAIGRFVMDTIQRIAQLESEQIGERVKVGMTQKAKKGIGYLGFGQPFGYSYQDRSLSVIESEAEIVQNIHSLYLGGLSMQDIAHHLDANNVSSKKGAGWSKEAVSNILHNPLYCGYVSWDGILRKGHHVPIISIDIYNLVQATMHGRMKSPSGVHTFIRPEGVPSYG
jgi:DNA invertase Pin-like site-specific DNA recombinase